MSVKSLAKTKLIWSIGISLLCSALVIFVMHRILVEVNKNQEKILSELRHSIAFPISVEGVEARWSGLSLGIVIKKIKILDSKNPIAFIAVEQIKLFPDLKSLIFDSKPKFKKIVLNGLQLMLGWDAKNSLSLRGLKGEVLPTTLEYARTIAWIAEQKNIAIENAQIDWQGPTLKFRQYWQGELKWVGSKTVDWKLSGSQKIQIREGFISPALDFSFYAAPELSALSVDLNAGASHAQCDLRALQEHGWQANCKAQIKNFNLAELHSYYTPLSSDYPLLQWLSKAIPKGVITRASVNLKGPLNALETEGEIGFKSLDFEYTTGWPKIEHANGRVLLDTEKIRVELSRGFILDAPIKSASAWIAPIGTDKSPVVSVEGSVESTLERGLWFLEQSPLQATVARPLKLLNPEGWMGFHLKLELPLKDIASTTVAGSVETRSATLKIPDSTLVLSQIQGNFRFSQERLEAEAVRAQVLDQNIELNLKTVAAGAAQNKTLEIATTGTLRSDFLQQQLPAFSFLEKLKGQALFKLTLKTPWGEGSEQRGVWVMSSDLQGMAVDLPGFFGKEANASQALSLTVGAETQGERKLSLLATNLVEANFVVAGLPEAFQLKQADLLFLRDNLSLYGLPLDKARLSVNFRQEPTQWILDGPLVKGSVILGSAAHPSIELKFDRLKFFGIKDKIPNTDFKLQDILQTYGKFPIVLHCGNLQYESTHWGEVFVKLLPQPYGYTIQDFSSENSISEIRGKGEWHVAGDKSYTTLQGKAFTVNMGKALSERGYPSAIRESSGYIQYQLSWLKHPFQFDVGTLEGTADLKLDKGRILGVNPGLGRILGLLTIENIQRRLQLDFSDVLKRGFVFDTLRGKFRFQKGLAHTEEFLIDGPSAKIVLSGDLDLKAKNLDLKMTVTPHGTTAIPSLVGLAIGNPVIAGVGAGLWFFNKITGSQINKVYRNRYHVTGTWDSPKIQDWGKS